MRDVERLLAAAAGRPEEHPLDLGDVRRRAGRQRATRAGAVVAACSALALLAGTAALGSGDGSSLDVVATTPPAVSPTPAPSPDPATPSPTASPAPGATTPATFVPTYDPVPVPYAETKRDDDLMVTVRVPTTRVAAGTEVAFAIDGRDREGHVIPLVSWGDQSGYSGGPFNAMCEGTERAEPRSVPYDDAPRHAWRRPGRYVVEIVVHSLIECEHDVPREQVTFEIPVEVTPGDSSANGPARPHATIDVRRDESERLADGRYRLSVGFDVTDADGYARTLVVDWGDGSPEQAFDAYQECDDRNGRRYPDPTTVNPVTEHVYPDTGRYEITLSFTSTGCDGSDPQHGGYTYAWAP